MTRTFGALFSAIAVSLAAVACTTDGALLDHAILHAGPRVEVRLARYYENLPFSYTGEVFRIQCRSHQTASAPAARMHEAGWANVTNGSAIGSTSAAQLADKLRANLRVLGDDVFVWADSRVQVTFDACGSFRFWEPEASMEAPTFDQFTLEGPAQLAFVVHTKSRPASRSVRTTDAGATWSVTH